MPNEINVPTCSLADWALSKIRLHAQEGKIAQVFADDGSSWTYAELLRHSVHVAAGLEQVGINRGDMVSLVTRNSHELFAIALGCVFADVIVTPSIPELSADELAQNFLAVKPKFIIAGESSISAVEEAVNGTKELNPKSKIFEVKKLFDEATAKGSHADPATFEPVDNIAGAKAHVFSCMFSSGTTGRPKAMTLTDYGFLRATLFSMGFSKRCSGPIINASQPNWVSWWYGMFRSLVHGWTRIFLDEVDICKILDAIHKFKPDEWFGLPSAIANLVASIDENPGRWDTSSLQLVVTVGEALGKRPHEYLSKKLNVDILQLYGSTETGAPLCSPNDLPTVYGSIGRPNNVRVKLVHLTTGKDITEPNNEGEIFVEEIVTKGYFNNPEANADMYDENGWFKTGDVAYFDENGDYFIVGRVKDMFKYKGFQISPHEVEDVIRTMTGVKEIAVIGKYAGINIGYVPTAFLVKDNKGSNLTEREVQHYFEKENLHDSKKLRGGVIFVDRLPRNAAGKILRTELRKIVNGS